MKAKRIISLLLVVATLFSISVFATNAAAVSLPAKGVANAQKVKSVMQRLGYSKNHIIGLESVITCESRFDTYSVECIYDEPFKIGHKKTVAKQCGYYVDTYTKKLGIDCPLSGHYKGGVGLLGFSRKANSALMSFAKAKKLNWYSIDAQTAYLLGKYNNKIFATYKKKTFKTPVSAANWLIDNLMRPSPAVAKSERAQIKPVVQYFVSKYSSWKYNKAYADKVIKLMK